MKHKVTIEVEVPEGWEPTGEFRAPVVSEPYLGHESIFLSDGRSPRPRIILRKVIKPVAGQVWRNSAGTNYLLAQCSDGRWECVGFYHFSTAPSSTPEEAVKGLTFVREKV